MTAKMFTSVAASAIFATASIFAPVAFAQSTQPADNSAPATKMAPAAPATTPAAATTNSAQAGSYLTEQSPDQVSANTYIGQSVYNGNNESIGKVTDLIMQKQGGIVATVIGVGGFLGIGQKNVAVPISNVTVAQNTQDGTVKLTTSETAETLKAAPEFKTLAMQSAEKAPSPAAPGMAPATDTTSTGSTTK
jgi:sporulation protein YlmC with PRC-barrel domain